ncbi:MAG: undecaprenyldiphospho-muramoylpentapeptide beta-N-acetylglucosaminyltransferase [Deltaproteobacteria bacterium]|jgi:UDP-N-acetylglucosamine--N-acetylmuramyl-(pentapeptide) pyrophosphoryl-undecaprenol N-acetylglucosamine transferase|nr:undecaprenyldiphospho-muramoylpentapeptide beta-N-acetylglucosaminyltransferase [Deltaproteobacteria bacterium]
MRIIFAAGGTGGHIMPAVAVAQAVKKLEQSEFLFVGAGRPAEGKILDPLGFKREVISSGGVKGLGILGKVKGGLKSSRGFFQAMRIIRAFDPDLIFLTGAYVSFPMGIAGKLLRIPLLIHEQNRKPGLSNRILSRFADIIFLGDEKAREFFPKKKRLAFTGNPVREEIRELSQRVRKETDVFTLLILGGSQGARAINQAVMGILKDLEGDKNFKIIHQAGVEGEKLLRPLYEKTTLNYELKDFFSDMPRVLGEANLAISRAGALTLAEFAAARLPSILIPLPTAADDHQSQNALSLVEAGTSILIKEGDLTPELLFARLSDLMDDRERLKSMSENCASLDKPDSAETMAKWIMLYSPTVKSRVPMGTKGGRFRGKLYGEKPEQEEKKD